MTQKPHLNVREMESKDVNLIADYWLNSDPDFLIGMGVDLSKLPPRETFVNMLQQQLAFPIEQKKSYALIWEMDGEQVGHSNVNPFELGNEATMHLHLWNLENRMKGMGTMLVKMSLPFYFQQLNIKTLWCEPYALNPAPNKTLRKLGFEFIKTYTTIPGSINYEQEVNRWRLTKEHYQQIINTRKQ